MKLKSYNQFLLENISVFSTDKEMESYFELMIAAADKTMDAREWIREFDIIYGSVYEMDSSTKFCNDLRTAFFRGDVAWKYICTELDDRGHMNKSDDLEFNNLKKEGWKIFDSTMLDNHEEMTIGYLFFKRYNNEEKVILGKKAINYIRNTSSENVTSLFKLISKEDIAKIRGTVQGKKFGV
jgi:hypothetical protein